MSLTRNFLIATLLLLSGTCVAQTCSVRTVSLNFGSYNHLATNDLEAEAGVYIACDPAVTFNISLDSGTNSGGHFSPRRLARVGSVDYLAYNIFRDPARIEIWGDGTGNTFTQPGIGTGVESQFIAYGRLPAGQSAAVGRYVDVVMVLVEW